MRSSAQDGDISVPTPVICVCDGDPLDPQTNSGVAFNFINALHERDDVSVIASVSSVPPRIVQLAVRALAFHPRPERWRLRSRRGMPARVARSLTRDVRVHRARPPRGTVLIHVRSFYHPSRMPYTSFIDTTVLDDDRNWSQWEDATPRQQSSRALATERRFYNQALLVATASHAAQRSLVSDYGVNPAVVEVVGGGTNVLTAPEVPLPAVEPSAASTVGSTRTTILFVGRDFLRKGGDLLLDASSILIAQGIDLQLIVVGCHVPHPPDWVDVKGFVSDRAQMRDLYDRADIFCLPARWEPYGLVVQEAMSAGVPVVVSDVGELAQIVGGGRFGVVVRRESVPLIVDALLDLIQNPARRLELSQRGQKHATNDLTWSSVGERFTKKLRKALPTN